MFREQLLFAYFGTAAKFRILFHNNRPAGGRGTAGCALGGGGGAKSYQAIPVGYFIKVGYLLKAAQVRTIIA